MIPSKPPAGMPPKTTANPKEAIMVPEGSKAPDFCLPAADRDRVCLKDFAGRWLVLYFYPRDNTGGCTTEALEFSALDSRFAALKASIVGVSPDTPASHRKFIEKHGLTVTLLSDAERNVLKAYGAFGKKKMYGREVEGVIRSTVLIDPQGVVRARFPKAAAKGHAREVLEALAKLAG
jgi:peroxiredoxin Q/BCP